MALLPGIPPRSVSSGSCPSKALREGWGPHHEGQVNAAPLSARSGVHSDANNSKCSVPKGLRFFRLTSGGEEPQPRRMPTKVVADKERAGMFSAVQHKRFRPLWAASILSGVAYMTAITACGWAAF